MNTCKSVWSKINPHFCHVTTDPDPARRKKSVIYKNRMLVQWKHCTCRTVRNKATNILHGYASRRVHVARLTRHASVAILSDTHVHVLRLIKNECAIRQLL